ncbi:MAG: DNA polymerase/3'-5' exonuclease PolX [Spirochaetaceae bacterium]|nr:MAG: DNA polymerase/3'-5' exonuclease PolX [Spirochaetaceae bacterium]
MNNKELGAVLKQIAVYQELAGENPFKSRAFERASRIVEQHPESFATLVAEGRMSGIQGIGKGIGDVLRELVESGRTAVLEELKAGFPAGLQELLTLGGLGPKRVRLLWEKLGISNPGELEYACRENRLLALEGFGEKSQEKILKSIAFKKQFQEMHLYAEAEEIAAELEDRLEQSGLFSGIHIAGSLRRGKRILKDADMLLIPRPEAEQQQVRATLTGLADSGPEVEGVLGAGETKVSIRRRGLQVDFRIVEQHNEPAALQHFTGSREHNTILRSRAKSMGLKMNEYGVFRGEERLPVEDEQAVYRALDLPWIAPELREGEEEVEAATAGKLPRLVETKEIRGMIHVHSSYSDGLVGVEEMARSCRQLGYEYLCLSDHSRSAGYAGGLSVQRLREQLAEAAEVNEKLAPFRIFCGIESDILGDGSLDYPDDVLAELDYVIGSVHSNLNMNPEAATQRLMRAVANPYLTILGHPSGALLLSRAGYEYDEQMLFTALEQNEVVLEHNCNPHRLDPDWPVLKRAARRGIRIALCPDAHSLQDLGYMRYGVLMARKAWLGAEHVLNCLSVEEIDGFFASRKSRANA